MTTPVALYLQDAHTIRHGMELVQYAEAKGFHAVWQADSRLVRDCLIPMAAFASVSTTEIVATVVLSQLKLSTFNSKFAR